MKAKPKRKPAEVFPPCEYLTEELLERGWSFCDFAMASGISVALAADLCSGSRRLTRITATIIAQTFGQNPQTWLNLRDSYEKYKNG